MRAISFAGYGKPSVLHIGNRTAPIPGRGELRIRVAAAAAAAAVSPADAKWRSGMFQDIQPLELPHIPGYDVAGTVDAIDDAVTGFQRGQRVIAMLDRVRQGGYAELAIVRADTAARCPGTLADAVAAAIPTAGLTGLQLIERHLRPDRDETILVTGATGGVGRFAIRAARERGAIVVAAVRDRHRAMALRLGVSHVVAIDSDPASLGPIDHVADTVGGAEVARLCQAVKAGGRIRTVATTLINPAGLVATPAMIGVEPDGSDLARVVGWVAVVEVEVPIDRVLPLEEALLAHRLIERGGLGGKLVLKP